MLDMLRYHQLPMQMAVTKSNEVAWNRSAGSHGQNKAPTYIDGCDIIQVDRPKCSSRKYYIRNQENQKSVYYLTTYMTGTTTVGPICILSAHQ